MTKTHPVCRLGSLVSVQGGFAFKSGDFKEIGVPVLKIKNIQIRQVDVSEAACVSVSVAQEAARYFCKTGDVLISMTGSGPNAPNSVVGRVARFTGTSDKYLINQRVGRFVNNAPEKLDQRYLFYVLAQEETLWKLVSISTGSANQANISGSQIANLEIPLPPLPEQKAIAAILGSLDDKIELNRRMNATLEAMARALFQSWFVDFDPVRAKMDGRVPVGMDAETAALFPDSFEDSVLGKIPKGWEVRPIGQVVECVGGGTPSTAEPEYWVDGTHHWATPKDLSSLQAPVLLNTDRKLTAEGVAKISSGLLPAGTLLMSSRAPVGYLAITTMPVAINQGFIGLKCTEQATRFFLLNWCQSNMAEIESRATGTTFAEISKQNFRQISLTLPHAKIMEAYTSKVSPLYAQITTNLFESRRLTTVLDALLPKLLNSDISVVNFENSSFDVS